jgi:ATP-dependent Clp protease ATP-binding subunit ClpA
MQKLFFSEPRLQMTIFGRFIIRLAGYATYGVLVVATLVFLTSEIAWLKSIGILLTFFLVDRLVDFNKASRSLDQLNRMNGNVNAAWFLAPASYKVIERSLDHLALQGGDVALYILKNLVLRKDIRDTLLRMDVQPEEFGNKVDEYINKSFQEKQTKKEAVEIINLVVTSALEHAHKAQSYYIEPQDIFAGLKNSKNTALNRLLNLFEIEGADLEYALIFSRSRSKRFGIKKLANISGLIGKKHKRGHRVMNRAWTARPTKVLDQFSTDLTHIARQGHGGFLVGHSEEYDRITDVLSRVDKPNALLVGEPGSGKGAVVSHLAFNIIRDQVPVPLFDKRLVMLEIGAVVAGAGEGELEDRFKKIVSDINNAGNIILYIPDIHNLLRTSEGAKLTAADVMLPAIKEGTFAVIGATYPREFKSHIEIHGDFAATFEVIKVKEINETEAVELLSYESIILEKKFGVVISLGAVKQSVTLAHKYFRSKLLPSSASDLLKESLADVIEKKKKVLLDDDVINVAEKKINIPIHGVRGEEAEKLLQLEERIHERLIDQEPAVRAVSRALREYRSGLSKGGRPIATFLFVGPTGVGKTELSKILATVQFGAEKFMIRFDMSEYQTEEGVFQLIGSPKGEVQGSLTGAVRESPYSLILLDEFEKAHRDVLNIFLAVFDDGRLTDSLGRTVDFQNTIVIATSNAHSEFIKSELEKGTPIENLHEEIKSKLTDYFKPELLNRFSDIIVFKTLSKSDIKSITKLLLADLAGQVEKSNGIILQFEESAVARVSELGYDPVFGARPLRKVISERIRGALAERILKNEIGRGNTVLVSAKEGDFDFITATEL